MASFLPEACASSPDTSPPDLLASRRTLGCTTVAAAPSALLPTPRSCSPSAIRAPLSRNARSVSLRPRSEPPPGFELEGLPGSSLPAWRELLLWRDLLL